MVLLHDLGQVETHFRPFGDLLILAQDRCKVCAEHTTGLKIILMHPRYSKVTWVNWKLISVYLEILLILAQGRCMVCAEHTIGSEIILTHPMVL
jgi:hypothetical protein